MSTAAAQQCFHCSEPLRGSKLVARIEERDEPVCCEGCLAVAEMVTGAGLSDYYRFREKSPARPETAPGKDPWSVFAQPQIAAQFIRSRGDMDYVVLTIEGMRCAACSWLIDNVLARSDGVTSASTNAATGRAYVAWDRAKLTLADIVRTIAQLGYRPHPLSDASVAESQQRERHDALKRLAVAAFGMMQVMMFAVAVYSAQLNGEVMSADLTAFFRIVSLLVATPVMFYSGAPIFAAAWQGLRQRVIRMDLPVALALLLAYCASVWNTLGGRGEVYFDSVTMFIFFMTLARFVQMTVRHRTADVSDALARQLPSYAHRLIPGGSEDVPAAALREGDLILIRPGEIIPVDGELIEGDAVIDEVLLTGEFLPVERRTGGRIVAGTLNVRNTIKVSVSSTASKTTLSHLVTLLERAQAQKPSLCRTADTAAARFLHYVLLGAGLTCAGWLYFDPSRAFEATLAVLVVACPCAFSIAMPTALTAATARLAQLGVLVTRPDALEALASIQCAVFDKTGTLTRGEVTIGRTMLLAEMDEASCLRIAAAIEIASEHPLARAFAPFHAGANALSIRNVSGAGIEGTVDGRRYRIGSRAFAAELRGSHVTDPNLADLAGTVITFGDEQRELAHFELRDITRTSAVQAVEALRELGIPSQILSGDSRSAVERLASQCSIGEWLARRSPAQKVTHVQAMQAHGRRVLMVGDGLNDAPVLASADVSVAMSWGAALAQAGADMVLVTEDLRALPQAVGIARRMIAIARQNLLWSAAYNFASLPLAALGFIPPWLAAAGMSISSVAVIINSARLLPKRERRQSSPGSPPVLIGAS